MDPVVVLGSGLAGYSTLRELRRRDKHAPVVLVSADDGAYYSKPALSNALAEGRSPLSLVLDPPERMAASTGARIVTRTQITAIDAPARRVCWQGGALAYSSLVLALGATPLRPRLEGDAAEALLFVNNLQDYAALRACLERARRVALLGAGLIGCEFANDLAGAGIAVDVIEMTAQPLPRLLPPQAGALLAARMEAIGVRWHFGAAARALDRAGAAGFRVALSDGQAVEADLVLCAIGLVPNVELARAAGLRVERGIAVGRSLETSVPGVYALGDCAEVAGQVLPFIAPIRHAARALGATLAGTLTEVCYPAMPVRVKTPVCPTIVASPPPGAAGVWQCEACEDGMRSLFRGPDGALLGFALNGPAVSEMPALARELPALLA
jgi:rubredoxin-NAD+ reductase